MSNNAILQKFLWQPKAVGLDIPLSVYDVAASATYYYFAAANKNIGQLIDSNGNIVAKYEYSPFGVKTISTGAYAATNPFRFSSEYYDSETKIIYYNYRYYIPALGRWLSRDPIEEAGGDNLFAFVNNGPISNWDSLGFKKGVTSIGPDDFRLGDSPPDPKYFYKVTVVFYEWKRTSYKIIGSLPKTLNKPMPKCNKKSIGRYFTTIEENGLEQGPWDNPSASSRKPITHFVEFLPLKYRKNESYEDDRAIRKEIGSTDRRKRYYLQVYAFAQYRCECDGWVFIKYGKKWKEQTNRYEVEKYGYRRKKIKDFWRRLPGVDQYEADMNTAPGPKW